MEKQTNKVEELVAAAKVIRGFADNAADLDIISEAIKNVDRLKVELGLTDGKEFFKWLQENVD